MAAKPTEIKKLVEILEADYETAADCAKATFNAVEQMLSERDRYIVVIQHWNKLKKDTYMLQSFGPFPTRDKAAKEAEKKVIGISPELITQWRVARLVDPDDVE